MTLRRMWRIGVFSVSAMLMSGLAHGAPQSYICPVSKGSGSGNSWANCAAWANLSALVSASPPGATIYIRADQGPYNCTTQTLTKGGTASGPLIVEQTFAEDGKPIWVRNPNLTWAPITIMGAKADLTPAHAILVGTRTAWTLPTSPEQVTNVTVTGWQAGGACVRLGAGANNLRFAYLNFQRFGNAIEKNTDVVLSNIEIGPVKGYNVRRFLEMSRSSATAASGITGLHIHDAGIIGYSKSAIRLRGPDTHHVLVERVDLNSGRQSNDDFATGVEINESAHRITIRNSVARNSTDRKVNTEFWNGDGFAAERSNHHIHVIDSEGYGNTDSAFDFKSTDTWFVRPRSDDNKTNYKMWGNIVLYDPIAGNTHDRGGTGGRHIFEIEYSSHVTVQRLFMFECATAGRSVFKIYASSSWLEVFGTGGVKLCGATLVENNAGGTAIIHP